MSKTEKTGAWLLGIAAWASIVVPIAVDWNSSHLFNPDWPPHAKLHDAMSFLMSMGLGAGALYLMHTRARRGVGDIWAAGILAIWSWGALLLARLAPGATYTNSAFDHPPEIGHVHIVPNAVLSVILVAMGLVGAWLIVKGRNAAGPKQVVPPTAA